MKGMVMRGRVDPACYIGFGKPWSKVMVKGESYRYGEAVGCL